MLPVTQDGWLSSHRYPVDYFRTHLTKRDSVVWKMLTFGGPTGNTRKRIVNGLRMILANGTIWCIRPRSYCYPRTRLSLHCTPSYLGGRCRLLVCPTSQVHLACKPFAGSVRNQFRDIDRPARLPSDRQSDSFICSHNLSLATLCTSRRLSLAMKVSSDSSPSTPIANYRYIVLYRIRRIYRLSAGGSKRSGMGAYR